MPFTSKLYTSRVGSCSLVNFAKPKFATFATILLERRILAGFTSRCIILGVQPVCRYSSPDEHPPQRTIRMGKVEFCCNSKKNEEAARRSGTYLEQRLGQYLAVFSTVRVSHFL